VGTYHEAMGNPTHRFYLSAATAFAMLYMAVGHASAQVSGEYSIAPGLTHPDNLPPAPDQDNGETFWPQVAAVNGSVYTLYTPQFESIIGTTSTGRAAFRIATPGAQRTYGAMFFSATLDNDLAAGLIQVSDMQVTRVQLAGSQDSTATTAILQQMLASATFTVQRSVVLENMQVTSLQSDSAPLGNAAPVIRVIDHPAVLLLLDGAPVLRDVGSGVGIAQNTPSLLAFDSASNTWFTRVGDSIWMHASSFSGPFTSGAAPTDSVASAIAAALPRSTGAAQSSGSSAAAMQPDSSSAAAPGNSAPAAGPSSQLPEIVVSTTPLCMVSINGAPNLAQVADGLFAISNANCDLFTATASNTWYLLASGRWFTSGDLMNGPWSYVKPSALPSSFAAIDPKGTWGNVLAAVPGTSAANDAIYQQSVPHVATLDRSKAKASLSTIGGAARFAAIDGTSLSWATNASSPLILCEGSYYLCQDAAWFTSDAATGPWVLCDAVPQLMYVMPPSSPVYGVTFVRVMGSTADTVTFGFTAGYMNSYVNNGIVSYGTGFTTAGMTAPGVAGNDYLGYPGTYGSWPNFGYAGWMYETAPGWGEYGLQCAPTWACNGWWGPGRSFGLGYALGMGYGGSWHWGYHPWGWRGTDGWWMNHWSGAYRRAWSDAARSYNRAAAAGDINQFTKAASSRTGVGAGTGAGAAVANGAAATSANTANTAQWRHAGGVNDDVSATRDGQVMQQRGSQSFARADGGWSRASGNGAGNAGAMANNNRAAGQFQERDGSTAATSNARSTTMDDFRPDPNHNFDGSPRGAFARGETNYADRNEGLQPGNAGRNSSQYARGGTWNGGGWDQRNGSTNENSTWSNGQRGYGELSGYTGARGIVRSDEDAGNGGYSNPSGYQRYEEPDGYAKYEHGGGAVSGYTGGGQTRNYSMFGYGMVGGQNPHYTWMGMWPGNGYYGGYYGGFGGYGGYGRGGGGMRMGVGRGGGGRR
jgi:hypothetical protein